MFLLKRFLERAHRAFGKTRRFPQHRILNNSQLELSPSKRIQGKLDNLVPTHQFNGGDVSGWQQEARSKLRTLLGLDRIGNSEVVSKEVMWEARDDLAVYQKSLLVLDRGDSIPIYVAHPLGNSRPSHWLVCLQGHTSGMHVSLGLDKKEVYWETGPHRDRQIGVLGLSEGFGVICIEQMSLGMRGEVSLKKTAPHPCFDASMQALLLGETLLGHRIEDVVSVIRWHKKEAKSCADYGVIGNSLGGTVALFGSAVSEEIDFCIPSCCISDFRSSIFATYHCADLYVPLLASTFRMGDIIGLSAPKYMLCVAGEQDPIFPIGGFRKAIREAEEIYSKRGADHNLIQSVGEDGHKFYSERVSEELRKFHTRRTSSSS